MKQVLIPDGRVICKFYFPSLGKCFLLQRKRWYGWKTTAWTYVETSKIHNDSFEPLLSYLIFVEDIKKNDQAHIDKMLSQR